MGLRRGLTWGIAAAVAVAGFVASPAAASPEKDKTQRAVYLTFDDGPAADTDAVLKVLRRYDARATFFVVGLQIVTHPSELRRIALNGHAIGNHSWSHPDLRGLSSSGIRWQVRSTSAAARDAGIRLRRCVRPPYGGTDARVRNELALIDQREVLWDVDPHDWQNPSVYTLTQRLLTARAGQTVLMHDGGGTRMNTVRALRHALPILQDRGLRFETVPACRIRPRATPRLELGLTAWDGAPVRDDSPFRPT